MVGTARDNWRYPHVRGTSKLHVIDKFTITLHAEYRRLYTTDPAWPKITRTATLPSLVLHVNEHKVYNTLLLIFQACQNSYRMIFFSCKRSTAARAPCNYTYRNKTALRTWP